MFAASPAVFGSGLKNLETVAGFKIRIDPRDYFGCMMVYGRYAPEVITVMREMVQPGDSVIDAGAQLGYMTGHLARLVGPAGACASFEPDPSALARLRWMIRENGFSWVKIFPLAAGDSDGKISFFLSPILGWSTAVTGSHLKDLNEISVKMKSIDDIAAARAIRRPVTFVKIDVEGFECAVLDGMKRLIDEDRPAVVLEINPRMLAARGDSSSELLSRLSSRGYVVYRISSRHGDFQGGRVRLIRTDPSANLGACDVLCLPNERMLPKGLV
jgi:FkbM family methyltransferase